MLPGDEACVADSLIFRKFYGLPFDPSRLVARHHQALKGDPNGAKKALAEIGRSYNISGRTIQGARGMKKTTPLRGDAPIHTRRPARQIMGHAGQGRGHLPHSIAVDDDGKLYVADRSNKRIQIFARR